MSIKLTNTLPLSCRMNQRVDDVGVDGAVVHSADESGQDGWIRISGGNVIFHKLQSDE